MNEEYSMLWVKSKSPDVPELVYVFCHYCSSFAGLNPVPFFARQSTSAMCRVLLMVSDLFAVHGLKYVLQSVELLYKIF